MKCSAMVLACMTIISATAIASETGGPGSEDRWQSDPMASLYRGEKAASWEDLQSYTGKKAAERIEGDLRRKAYLLNYEQLGINYGDNVEYQLRQQQVILCPQTAEFLYGPFTSRTARYRPGSRPALEAVVCKATAGLVSQREKMLALMRFCRDLYDKKWLQEKQFAQYIYGGTEEQLIEKGELLCETLGRLMIALCEIAGMPGRIVMHDIGGHIAAEILVDGHWAYVDPRTGFYCVEPDGSLASVWELWHNPALLEAQPDAVKADIGDQWTWQARAWKCQRKYFHPSEINGFQNYSLADAGKYRYGQLAQAEAIAAGLREVNRPYVEAANAVFGLEGDGFRLAWAHNQLRKIPIAYRHDGFSMYYEEPVGMTRESLLAQYVEPFRSSNVDILVWGVGPGSVFCYDTKVGQIFGACLNDQQWKLMREGDRRVYENVTGLIRAGADPLKTAVAGAHAIGRKLFARLEMNHEYGPADEKNWLWVGFVGDLNKKNPQYRIPGSVRLDFKHREVRDCKLAIFREALEAGADGLEMDFAVYPPFFAEPDCEVMTQFVRDVRALADRTARWQNRRIDLMARVPCHDAEQLGLDWKTWMRDGLVDILVPTHRHPNESFDINIDEFISLRNQTACKIYPTLWQALGFVDTDARPDEEKKGIRRYDKPKTKEMFFAQAMLFHRAGADGLELGFAAKEWNSRPWLNDLADPAKVEFADKHYMVDPKPHCPVRLGGQGAAGTSQGPAQEKTVPLRIGDDPAKAIRLGYQVEAELVLYGRALKPGESIAIFVNGHGPASISAQADSSAKAQAALDVKRQSDKSFIYDRDWWQRGQLRVPVPGVWWQLGPNTIRLVHRTERTEAAEEMSIVWIDLVLRYKPPR